MIYVCKIHGRKIANSRLVMQSKRKDKRKEIFEEFRDRS